MKKDNLRKLDTNQEPSLSIVIPVYNEESGLEACLAAIARQTVLPEEVIIVDNNSSDNSIAIAQRYSFVRVVREPAQGLVFARTTGFNAAKGEIIGRIDADTHLSSDWVARVKAIMNDKSIDAVSGSTDFYDMLWARQIAAIFNFLRRGIAKKLSARNELFLYGSNMAVRQSAWRYVREKLCVNHSLHEDMDMAAHFAHTSFVLRYDERMRVAISARRAESSFRSFYLYVVANARTYAAHGLRGRFYMYPLQWLGLAAYALLKMLHRGYDPRTGKFMPKRLFRPLYEQRVSPVSDL